MLDLWNKPLPGLIYGVAGLLGIAGARLVSVAFTVATAVLTARLCERLIPFENRRNSWTFALFFVAQMAVLKDSFVTMTEIPAAFFLALSLWLCVVRGERRASALAAGLVSLCRAEMLPVTCFVGVWLALDVWRASDERAKKALRCALPPVLALLPFAAWVGAGVAVSGDASWFRRNSYAYIRSWDLAGVLHYNVITGLPAVIALPALLLFLIGVLDVLHGRDEAARWQLSLLAGALAIHYLLLNSLAVFPRGWYGLPSGHAIAAVNARNYTPTAPIAAVFVALGVAAWVNARQNRPRFAVLASVAAAATACAIAFGRIVTGSLRVLELSLLALMLLVLLLTSRLRLRYDPYDIWKFAALVTLGSSLLIRPFFWYPTRWNDRRAASIQALSTMVRKEGPARVIQDLASSLGVFGNLQGVDATWTYPHEFSRRLEDAPPNTILVLELDANGKPLPRYPVELRAQISGAPHSVGRRFEVVGRFDSPAQPSWLTLVDRVASANAPVHWLALRFCRDCGTALSSLAVNP